MMRECDKHNARIKEKAVKIAKEERGGAIEAAVYAHASGKSPEHYLGRKLYKKVFNQ